LTQIPKNPFTESSNFYNPTQKGWNQVPERKSFAKMVQDAPTPP
jgi:hypothetical protein